MGVKVNNKSLAYDESHLQWQKGLQGIRKRPEMYIHSIDSHGVWTLAREAADNAADENGAGRNAFVHILQDKDDSIWILDHGKGIPVAPFVDPETKKKDGRTTFEIMLSETHSGGKFGTGAYEGSRGTHGVGVKATNALSSLFQVWTCYKGVWWFIEFARGKLKKAPAKVKAPKLPHGLGTAKNGTIVRFVPDDQIFHKGSKFLPPLAAQWCELTAYMQAGFRTKLTDKNGKTKEWCFKNGSKEYLDHKIKKLEANQLGKDCLITEGCFNIALAFTDYDGIALEGFTNGLSNTDGGTHIDTFYKALAKSLEPFKGKTKYNPSDLREGIVGFINVRLDEPKFGSQTKEKLVDETPKKQYEVVVKALSKFFDANKGLAKKLTQRASELKSLKDQFIENKKVLKELSGAAKKGKAFAENHSRCDCAPELRELFVVEGESAAGCFVQDTPVLMHDGSIKTFAELVLEEAEGKKNTGVAFDLAKGEPVAFTLDEPRLTKYVSELIEVTLSDGTTFQCTTDHPWLLDSGEYVAAENLKSGDCLKTIKVGENRMTTPISVISVRRIQCSEPVPVYDATSPQHHNFSLGNGVIVHNTAKDGRLPGYQEILPLKGKILNVMKGGASKKDKAFDSEQVMNILIGIGYDPSSKSPLDNLRIGKLILLADPDPDGRHINTLQLTLLAKYLAGMYARGTVYIINLPEYVMEHGSKNYFGDSPKEIEKALPKGTKLKNVQHLKGLGEMTAIQLRELAFDPATRKLLKISPPSKEEMKEFTLLMSDNTDYRRKLLGV